MEIDIGVRILDTPIVFMAPLFVVKARQIGATVKGCKTDTLQAIQGESPRRSRTNYCLAITTFRDIKAVINVLQSF